MIRSIFGISRGLVGLMGAVWLVGGLWGIVKAALDHAWGPTFVATLYALVGFCLAYGAFVRFPWEPDGGRRSRRPIA